MKGHPLQMGNWIIVRATAWIDLAEHVRIKNIPLVKDIFTMIDLLNFIGCKTKLKKKENIIEIINKTKNVNTLAN